MASRSRRDAKPLKRRVATRAPRRTFTVFCEGERTEPEYLDALKRQPSVRDAAAVDLHVHAGKGGSVPLQLVSMAVTAKRRAAEEEGEIDEFWCVFDVESPRNHPRLGEAVELAQQNGISVAVSNPCFELWLILHFQDQNGELTTSNACRLRERLDGSKDKGLDARSYMAARGDAARRAVKLDEMHRRNDKQFPKDNPSSGMCRLLAAIETGENQRREGGAVV